uniref:Uncharacterized protein n=1 Tax=Oryza brachyantha TaxID=4533 RepID=J3MIG1_ORYBR
MADPNRPPRPRPRPRPRSVQEEGSAAGYDTGFVPSVHDPIYIGSLPPHPHPGIIGSHRARAPKPTGADHMRVLFPPGSTSSHASIDTRTASAIDGLAYCQRNITSSLGGGGTATRRSALATGGFTGHVAREEERPGGRGVVSVVPRGHGNVFPRGQLAQEEFPTYHHFTLGSASGSGGGAMINSSAAPAHQTMDSYEDSGFSAVSKYWFPSSYAGAFSPRSLPASDEWDLDWLHGAIIGWKLQQQADICRSVPAVPAAAPFADTDIQENYMKMIKSRAPPSAGGSGPGAGIHRRQPLDTSNGGGTTRAQMVRPSTAGGKPHFSRSRRHNATDTTAHAHQAQLRGEHFDADACENTHGAEELRVVAKVEGWRPRGPCMEFATKGWCRCRYGGYCWEWDDGFR